MQLYEKCALMQVPVEAAHAVGPDGQTYTLKWVQDENGRLHLQDHKKVDAADIAGSSSTAT